MVRDPHAAGEKPALLTAQEEAMWKMRHRPEMQSFDAERKKAFNRSLRQKLKAMSAADLATTRAALQAEWDAMPPGRKEKIAGRIANRTSGAEAGESRKA